VVCICWFGWHAYRMCVHLPPVRKAKKMSAQVTGVNYTEVMTCRVCYIDSFAYMAHECLNCPGKEKNTREIM
jgi:hypothetical protein